MNTTERENIQELVGQLSIERSLNLEYQKKLVTLANELQIARQDRDHFGMYSLAQARLVQVLILKKRAEAAESALRAVRDRFRSDPDMSGRNRWHQVGSVSVAKIVEIIDAVTSPSPDGTEVTE